MQEYIRSRQPFQTTKNTLVESDSFLPIPASSENHELFLLCPKTFQLLMYFLFCPFLSLKKLKGKRWLLKLFSPSDSDTLVSSFLLLPICCFFIIRGIYIPCWWLKDHICTTQTQITFDNNILLLILVQVWYIDKEVPSTLKFLSCLSVSFGAQHPAEVCSCLLPTILFSVCSYLAILSQIPWPPYFAGSTGAPAFLTIILRVNRLPFIPAASSLRWISSERLRRKASASLGWRGKTTICLDNYQFSNIEGKSLSVNAIQIV